MAIVVRVDPGHMEAIVEVERQNDDPLDVTALRHALTEAGVTYGIDDAACNEVIRAANQTPPANKIEGSVARGTPPVDGDDGRVELAVDYARNPVGTITDAGNMDFHDHGSFTGIAAGQLIARITLPTTGTAGSDVRGTPLKANPGRPARFKAGQGTKVEAGGTELRATRTGDLRCAGDVIEVLDMIRIAGNLDYAVGNIQCEGPVRVEGDVLPGFYIRAGGDVWIGGVTDSAEVTSAGAVTIAQGVLKNSRVCANGKIMVGYARDAYLESGANILITTECLNSTVVSGDSITLPEKARVIGGRLFARNRIETGIAGQEKGAPTVLAAGIDPLKKLRAAKLRAEVRQAESVQTRLERLKEMAAPDRRALLDQFLDRVLQKREGHAEELSALVQEPDVLEHCEIKVRRRLCRGVRIRIGADELQVEEEFPGATFRYDPNARQVVQIQERNK